MNTIVDCYVGALRSKLDLPDMPLVLSGTPIEQFFSRFSKDTTERAHIALRMRTDRLLSAIVPPAVPTDASTLRVALGSLIGGQPGGNAPTRVGLVLADSYEPRPTLFGYMFDEGVFDDDPAREGCAVFVNAIRDYRRDQGAQAVASEIGFTAVHELGHVFNLWHMHSPPNAGNFMSRSGPTPFGPDAFSFDPYECQYLTLADSEPMAHPAGPAYGLRPSSWPQGDDAENAPRSRRRTALSRQPLEFRIAMHQREFWAFEPVELDVELRLRRGLNRMVRIPDEIDPGYSRFEIWIEEPSGERRRYRPPRRYCTNPGTIEVEPRRPFRRDVSIFAGAGGYTFRAAGGHRVWAVLHLTPTRSLRSNRIDVEVRPARPMHREYRDFETCLANRNIARLLYHRRGALGRRDDEVVAAFLRRWGNTASAAALAYALGRHFAARARSGGTSMRQRSAVKARRFLRRASDHMALKGHRRRLSRRRLAELERE